MEQLDFFIKLDLSERQKIAEEEHRKFVDFMYPLYGLEENPGYCKIIIKRLWISLGGISYNDRRIYIDANSITEQVKYTAWHESGHFLHWKRRSILPERKQRGHYSNYKWYDYVADPIDWKECVANLGGLIFFDSKEGLNFDNAKKYFGREKTPLDKDEIALVNIARTNRGLLKRIAGHKNVYKSMKLIRSHSQ